MIAFEEAGDNRSMREKETLEGTVSVALLVDPHHYIVFGDWHCYELGLYLNTPGEFDGEARFWADNIVIARRYIGPVAGAQ